MVVTAACTPGRLPSVDDDRPPAPEAVITKSQAKEVFERYDRVNAAADAALDGEAIRKVQTGVLLRESLADYRLHRMAKTKDGVVHFTRARFVIPTATSSATYPRFFVTLSKFKGEEKDLASRIHYFTQPTPDAPWKATAAIWALTEPFTETPPVNPSPTNEDGEPVIEFRPKLFPGFHRTASGAAQLSPTAQAARTACARYADYLSFTVPDGPLADKHFTQGAFTNELVQYFNSWEDRLLVQRFNYRTVGSALPAFRLAGGSSLVACTYERTDHAEGYTPSDTVRYDRDSPIDLMLGGSATRWYRVDVVSSLTALIEVPPKASSPATVLACDCYNPSLLSATGTPAFT
ncbi:hypothetical protein P8605_01105 [Streptomyces sp. T-3]|nr:hypothetical protein [Streptomyces sp. T-3]